jgi:hypothetical protein
MGHSFHSTEFETNERMPEILISYVTKKETFKKPLTEMRRQYQFGQHIKYHQNSHGISSTKIF